MSINSKFFFEKRNTLLNFFHCFKKFTNPQTPFLSGLIIKSLFCWQAFFILLFLSVTIASGIFLQYYCTLSLSSQGEVSTLFLTPPLDIPIDSFSLSFIEENSLKAIFPSWVPLSRTFSALAPSYSGVFLKKKEVSEYVVQPGDTLSEIAQRFGVSLNTILWANKIVDPVRIKPGQKLIILPVSGVLHYVEKGETLSEIVNIYGGDIEEIINFNELSEDGKIYVGDLLIIPGGKIPKKSYRLPQPISIPLPKTLFIYPIPYPHRITQGLHWYNAVDFSNGKCGEPVFAVAGGKVQKTGYHKIAGKYIRLLHPSGIVTFYGHLSKILVKSDENVLQGQIIGYTGYSGYTIPPGPAGCHLHFEVRGARNPFAKYKF